MARLFILPCFHITSALLIVQMAWQFSCASSQCTGEICPEEGESAQSLLQMRKHDLAQTEFDQQSESNEESNDLKHTDLEHQIEGDNEAHDEGDEEASLSMGGDYHDNNMAANSSISMSCTQMSLNSAESQILYAWTTDTGRPYGVKPTHRIFQQCQESIESRRVSIHDVSFTKGDDVASLANSENSAVGIKGSYGFFQADAGLKVGSSSSSSYKKQHRTYNNWWSQKRVYWKSIFEKSFLTEEAKKVLKTKDAKFIVDRYGHFFARSIHAGGLLSVDYELLYESKKTIFEVDAEFKAAYGKGGFRIGTSASHKQNSTKLKEGTSVTESWQSYGGDSSLWSKLKPDLSNKVEIQQEWAKSINDANMMASKLVLAPIWELADTRAKENEIKTYLQNQWRIKPGKVHVLRYAEGNIRSTMDACTLVTQKGGCWNLNDLGAGCNKQDNVCLKYGNHCNTGDIILPAGIQVQTYVLYFGSNWDKPCNADGWYIKRSQFLKTPGWHQTLDRPCAYRFSISDTNKYVCN